MSGLSRVFAEGTRVRVRLPKSLWHGDVFIFSDGMFRGSRSARYGSERSSVVFFIRVFAALTAFSAFPFDCGYVGELVMCSNPHAFANSTKLLELNGGPLSVTTRSGQPCRAKCAFSLYMTSSPVFCCSLSTSKKSE